MVGGEPVGAFLYGAAVFAVLVRRRVSVVGGSTGVVGEECGQAYLLTSGGSEHTPQYTTFFAGRTSLAGAAVAVSAMIVDWKALSLRRFECFLVLAVGWWGDNSQTWDLQAAESTADQHLSTCMYRPVPGGEIEESFLFSSDTTSYVPLQQNAKQRIVEYHNLSASRVSFPNVRLHLFQTKLQNSNA